MLRLLRMCPFYKTVLMAKNYVAYYNAAQRAVENGMTFNKVSETSTPLMKRLMSISHPTDQGRRFGYHLPSLPAEIRGESTPTKAVSTYR